MVKTQRRRKSRKSRISSKKKTVRRSKRVGGGTTGVEITRYYMDGCPACEMSKDAWQKFKKTAKARTDEIESANIPESANIEAYPTYIVRKDGKETNRKQGAITKVEDITQLLQG